MVRVHELRTVRPIHVIVRGGVYYLNEPLEFRAGDSGTAVAPIVYAAHPGELVTVSGGQRLACDWCSLPRWHRDVHAPDPGARPWDFSQLFINGRRQTLARYPNRDDSAPKAYSGYVLAAGKIGDDVPDPHPGPNDDMVFSGARLAWHRLRSSDLHPKRVEPARRGGIHIFQSHGWGKPAVAAKDVDRDHHRLWFGRGGQQMGAKWAATPATVNERSRFFVENVFEELDAPGEWYLDQREGILYFHAAGRPRPRRQPSSKFRCCSNSSASSAHPTIRCSNVTCEGFRFAQTASTFSSPMLCPRSAIGPSIAAERLPRRRARLRHP